MSRFIVIEGLDGAGTTTQVAALAQHLRSHGHVVHETHEPTDGPVGRLIRASLRGAEGSVVEQALPWMFAADRADHLSRTVDPALHAGTWVVSDRYLHSSLAYQSLVLPLDDVYDLNRTFRVPDLTVFVDVDVEVCLARIEARGGVREIFERRDRLVAIRDAYEQVLDKLYGRGDPIVRVDGDAEIATVTARIVAAVSELDG